MTVGPKLFQAFGWAGILFVVVGSLCALCAGPDEVLTAFGVMGIICFAAGALSWFACWLFDLFKPWRF